MLTSEQEKILQAEVVNFLLDQGGKPSLLVGTELAGHIRLDATAFIAAQFIVKEARKKVDVLSQVLKVLDFQRENLTLVPIWILAQNWEPLTFADMFSAIEVSDGPFVDRDSLRKHLRKLLDDDANPILLVNGGHGSGKSYSARMIVEDLARQADIQVAPLKVEPISASIWEIHDMASDLVRWLSTQSREPPTHAVLGDRLAGLLADWTADEIGRSGDGLWILLDGFDHPDLPEASSKYIDELLAMMGADERLERTRMILFEFDAQRLDSLTQNYNSLVLHLPDQNEVLDYFTIRFPGLSELHWESASAVAMENLPQGGPTFMPKLQRNIRRAQDVLTRI